MKENGLSRINIHFYLYITNCTLFYKTLITYTFFKVSGLIRKWQICIGINFHVDIDMKTKDAYFCNFLIFL